MEGPGDKTEAQLREQVADLEEQLSSTVSARDLTIRDLRGRVGELEAAVLTTSRHVLGKCDCHVRYGSAADPRGTIGCAAQTEKVLSPFVEVGPPPQYQHRLRTVTVRAPQGDSDCSGCGRPLAQRPNDVCPSVVHWRAWAESEERAMAAMTHSFEADMTCTECGEPMLAPVSLWRCKTHPNEHQAVGPGIAFEIRTKLQRGGSHG